uniref:Uncharacterized protein n=1 Tax=Ditylenchus dipsaci TaxID=166011 RepID=A0A915E5X7_9BILA
MYNDKVDVPYQYNTSETSLAQALILQEDKPVGVQVQSKAQLQTLEQMRSKRSLLPEEKNLGHDSAHSALLSQSAS